MHRKNTVEIKRRATLWAIYETTSDGLVLVRREVIARGKPKCDGSQVAITIANGYVLFTMAYDEFVKNAKSEFIKEDKNNAD